MGPEKDRPTFSLLEATGNLTYSDPLDVTAPVVTAKRLELGKLTGGREMVGDEFLVYMSIADRDNDNVYLGVAHIAEGDWFWAVHDVAAKRWEVVMQSVGYDRCTALAKGAITGVGTKTVDNVSVIRGTSPLSDPTSTTEELSVENPHTYDVDDNGLVRIEWNETNEVWEIYQATCPA